MTCKPNFVCFVFLVIISNVVFSVNAKSDSRSIEIFQYEDFGPQAIAWEIIDMQWWQWANHGSSDPNVLYDIKVVVYDGIELNEIKSMFPVVPEDKLDFRYVTLQEAIKYIDTKLMELDEIEEGWAVSVKNALLRTRNKLTLMKKVDH